MGAAVVLARIDSAGIAVVTVDRCIDTAPRRLLAGVRRAAVMVVTDLGDVDAGICLAAIGGAEVVVVAAPRTRDRVIGLGGGTIEDGFWAVWCDGASVVLDGGAVVLDVGAILLKVGTVVGSPPRVCEAELGSVGPLVEQPAFGACPCAGAEERDDAEKGKGGHSGWPWERGRFDGRLPCEGRGRGWSKTENHLRNYSTRGDGRDARPGEG